MKEDNKKVSSSPKVSEFVTDFLAAYSVSFATVLVYSTGHLLKYRTEFWHAFNWANISPNINIPKSEIANHPINISNSEVGDLISVFLVMLIPAVLGAIALNVGRHYLAQKEISATKNAPQEIEMDDLSAAHGV